MWKRFSNKTAEEQAALRVPGTESWFIQKRKLLKFGLLMSDSEG